ncbi:MAG: hypothetical protein JNN15_17710 [Blastocatellia bacterium]|nr:hypothetical protein [Blastocatellia bacterium]
MKFEPYLLKLTALIVTLLLIVIGYTIYNRRSRHLHEEACFDAMLRMILQPTQANIGSLDKLLSSRKLAQKKLQDLLHKAEMEADCLSIMPTGELRSSQPFLQKRYSQILASSEQHSRVSDLVKSRMSKI